MKFKNIGYLAIVATTAGMFVLGSAIPGEAAKKKKAEAAPLPPTCLGIPDKAVCGTKGGLKFTYANSCYAGKDGAKVSSDKACPVKAAKKAKSGGGKAKKAKKAKK